jgi:hypothetical protein
MILRVGGWKWLIALSRRINLLGLGNFVGLKALKAEFLYCLGAETA